MGESNNGAEDVADSWNTYWQDAQRAEAYTGGGSTHPLVVSFWDEAFAAVHAREQAPRVVDVASGNGALVRRAQAVFGNGILFACVDISSAAAGALEKRFSGVQGVVADARRMPFVSNSFDAVVSQFGIEYAGLDAVVEAARLLVPGGEMVLLLHYRGGGIHRQCAAALDAVGAIQDAGFIPRSIKAFEHGFATIRGGDRAAYEAAAKDMVPAVRTTESVIRRYGRQVAEGTVFRLYRDVKAMHARMQHYDPVEVLGWLRGMQDEMTAYAGRMRSMCEAAIDAARFEGICEALLGRGFELQRREALVDSEHEMPLAWSLIARRKQGAAGPSPF